MAQARRIKQKPKSKAKKARKPLNLPWGLLVVILVSGIILGMLISGARSGDSEFGAGLKQLFAANDAGVEPDDDIVELINEKATDPKKEFDFYNVLPNIEQIMPDDLPESTPTRPDANLDYYLQAASFKQAADADKLRARFALKGFKSVTQASTNDAGVTYYRVRLGPYSNKRKAKTAKNKLQKLGVRPFVYSVKKEAL